MSHKSSFFGVISKYPIATLLSVQFHQ